MRTLIPDDFIGKFYQTRRNDIKSSQTQVMQEKGEFPGHYPDTKTRQGLYKKTTDKHIS